MNLVTAGAMGFVLKTSGKMEFEKAIHTIMSGESYFSNELLRQIIVTETAKIEKQESLTEKLSLREKEILQLFCEGFTVTEMAAKLFLSPKTIEAHRSTLLKKTNSKNTINLVLFAIKNKLVRF
jgi:DNA-binding NarL/FixJ family response regulator